IVFTYHFRIKAVALDFFCVRLKKDAKVVRSSQLIDMRPSVVRIDFAEVSYVNYDATVNRDFDIFALLFPIKLEEISFKLIDPLRTLKYSNSKRYRYFAEHLPVEVETAAPSSSSVRYTSNSET
ncbi:MAG: hypothetical protein Q9163_002265, partial [Psora crenata]